MMPTSNILQPAQAWDDLRLAGQWLALLGFKVNVAAPTFSPLISTYHEVLDPSGEEAIRLEAASTMLLHVRRQLVREELRGQDDYAQKRPSDPYGLIWQTTERGAALFMIGRLLSEAIESIDGSLNPAN
ncbi:MAG: hypothetical protein R3D80_05575 [Paracoccaceae bacterium]